ncbi:31c4d89c-fb5b-4832-a7db-b4a82cd20366 [Thermothielavioides terrestris]|uniref:31c4d89c-fb5b-4832-a7db-b4a82cd20366 n=1 Tax=Thermothielavioides terrestris TaxID=2587410 RepID=A0A446BR08_9PEZI|nr:31c4d89c-fb5b-4832-a7db-b4a82cd20366 [Thermothielavioides terrestris]
MRAFELELSPN